MVDAEHERKQRINMKLSEDFFMYEIFSNSFYNTIK